MLPRGCLPLQPATPTTRKAHFRIGLRLRPLVALHLGVSVRWSLAWYQEADHIYVDVAHVAAAVVVVIVCGIFFSFFLYCCMYRYTLSVRTSIPFVRLSMSVNNKPLSLSGTPYSQRKIPSCEKTGRTQMIMQSESTAGAEHSHHNWSCGN